MKIFGKTGHGYFVGTSWKLVPLELKLCKAGFERMRMNNLQLRRLSLEGIQGGGGFPLEKNK